MRKPKASISAMIVVIIVFAASLILPLLRGQSPIDLGLDLSGGVIVTYQPDLTNRLASHQDASTAELLELAKETLVSRLYRQLETQPDVVIRGDQRIVVSLPSHRDSREILQLMGKTYHLTLRLVESRHPQPFADRELASYRDAYLELAEAEFSGDMLDERAIRVETGAAGSLDSGLDGARVSFRFKSPHDAAFADFTTRHVGRELAILIDDRVEWAGIIESPIAGSGVLQGGYTLEEASEIAMMLRAGTLPIPLEVESLSAIGPSLGQAMKDLGVAALVWSLIFLAGLLVVAYLHRRRLLFAGLLSLAFLLFSIAGLVAALGLTLDLVGIAGLILSVGMGMDAFLIVFESLERKLDAFSPDELTQHQDRIVGALYGFAGEGKTLFHANATTLLVVALLFATERLASFALFICVGILASLLTIVFTRWLLRQRRGLPSPSALGFLSRLRRLRPRVFRLRKLYFALLMSFVLVGGLLLTPLGNGTSLELGDDFKPGTQIVILSSNEASIETALDELAERWSDVTWRHQRLGEAADGRYLITVGKPLTTTLAESAAIPAEASATLSPENLAAIFVDHAVELESIASIDDRVSSRRLLQSLSVFALSFACLGLYFMVLQGPLDRLFGWHRRTAARTRWRIFLGITLAVVTDVLVVLTFLALGRIPINLAVIAALLTIVGYSVNDSVVLWSHLQSQAVERGASIVEQVTKGVDQLLSRAWLTSLSTMAPAIAILAVGLDPLADFAWTIIVGTVQGTLSSLFIVGSFAVRALATDPGRRTSRSTVRIPASTAGSTRLSQGEIVRRLEASSS